MDELNIIIPVRCQHAVKALADGERGRLMLGIVDYCAEGREPGFTGGEKYLWPEFKAAIDEQREKDIASKRARVEAGRLGGLAKLSNAKQCYNDPPSSPFETPNNPPKKRVSKDTLKESPLSDADFDVFWAAYPKKKAKADAIKAFKKVQAPLETILSALQTQKKSDDWIKDNGQFIPYPATWLNGRRWEDDVAPSATETQRPKRRFVSTGDFEGYWEEEQNGKWVRI